ncbi:TPA: hypothetical protein EYP83_02155 [Candidatus Geothermarchaeota archaeon]|nr:hypothetical protein [Candidatus Geothermarchaeota archaeon]HIQ12785.1 hypothetical protein [Thermoprotei archaeon]
MEENRVKLLIILIPFVIAFASLGVIGLFTSKYFTVSEVITLTSVSRVSVMGNVSAGSVRWNGTHMIFIITDGYTDLPVIYNGLLQLDNSTSYAQVTIYGVYYPEEGYIYADNVLFKCPSKEEIEAYKD